MDESLLSYLTIKIKIALYDKELIVFDKSTMTLFLSIRYYGVI